MRPTGRLSFNLMSAFYAADDPQPAPFDERYGEDLQTAEFSRKRVLTVTEPTKLDDAAEARFVIVTNLSGSELTTFPDEVTAAKLAKQVLRVGFSRDRLPLRLLPCVPGSTSAGTPQPLWLAPGAEVWIAPESTEPVRCRVVTVPGS